MWISSLRSLTAMQERGGMEDLRVIKGSGNSGLVYCDKVKINAGRSELIRCVISGNPSSSMFIHRGEVSLEHSFKCLCMSSDLCRYHLYSICRKWRGVI